MADAYDSKNSQVLSETCQKQAKKCHFSLKFGKN